MSCPAYTRRLSRDTDRRESNKGIRGRAPQNKTPSVRGLNFRQAAMGINPATVPGFLCLYRHKITARARVRLGGGTSSAAVKIGARGTFIFRGTVRGTTNFNKNKIHKNQKTKLNFRFRPLVPTAQSPTPPNTQKHKKKQQQSQKTPPHIPLYAPIQCRGLGVHLGVHPDSIWSVPPWPARSHL